MSESDKPAPTDSGKPKYRRPEMRVEFALAKYYGLGEEGEWSIQEIADELNVSPSTVEDYVYNTDKAQEVSDAMVARQARTKMDIIVSLKDRIDMLTGMLDERMEQKDIIPTKYRMETVKAEVSFGDVPGMRPPQEAGHLNEITIEKPVIESFKEVTGVDEEVKWILKEIDKAEKRLEKLLGIQEPEKREVTQTKRTEKIYRFEGVDDALPEQEAQVIDVESTPVDSDE